MTYYVKHTFPWGGGGYRMVVPLEALMERGSISNREIEYMFTLIKCKSLHILHHVSPDTLLPNFSHAAIWKYLQ